jgi:carbamoyltransferase
MGDNGIGLGAAILKSVEIGEFKNNRWDNVFLGKGYSNEEVFDEIDLNVFTIKPLDPSYIAEKLIEGKLIGLFRGRSEYGPRALGNRTILCDPRKKENHEYINKKLKRNEIMPFAPIIMSEHISDVCYAYKSLRAAEFMTLCFTVKEHWIDKIPAVIQNDDATCRAQIIFKDRNRFCWEVLEQFYTLTGVPVLLNTSFNSHGEPIINHPSHALDHFKNDIIDVLVLNNMIIEKK